MRTDTTGLLLAFDGVDSSGKETQAGLLSERLRYQGFTVRYFETPDYSTASGQELKERLQNKRGNWHETPWEEKMRLFSRNRLEHKAEVEQALKQGEIVVYDRYVASSLTFITIEALGAEKVDLFRDEIQEVVAKHEYQENGMPREHAAIFLDVPPLVSAALLEHRKRRQQDEAEYTDHIAVQQRLYNEYDVLWEKERARYIRIKCVVGEELLSVQDISELVWEALRIKFPFLEKKHA
jgi:dTMP kinase